MDATERARRMRADKAQFEKMEQGRRMEAQLLGIKGLRRQEQE